MALGQSNAAKYQQQFSTATTAKQEAAEASKANAKAIEQSKQLRKTLNETNSTLQDRLKLFKAEKELQRKIEKNERDRVRINKELTKTIERQKAVGEEIAGQMTGLQEKFNGLIESLPFGNIIAKQANLGGMLEQTSRNVQASLMRSFRAGESGIVAFAKAGKTAMAGLGAAIKSAFGPLLIIGAIIALIIALVKHTLKLNEQQMAYRKELGVSNAEAKRLQSTFGTTAIGHQRGLDLMTAQNEALGYATRLREDEGKLLAQQAKYGQNTTQELGKALAAARFMQVSYTDMYDNVKATVKELRAQGSVHASEAKVLKEIAALSKDTMGYFAGRTKEMVKQVAMAKEMNLTLDKTMSVSRGLLDIENSIQKEMEAEVLLGKDLNFDMARKLAMQGDYAGAAKELQSQVGDLSGMDMIQLDAIAAATGMSVGELQGMASKDAAKEDGTAPEIVAGMADVRSMKEKLEEFKQGFVEKILNWLNNNRWILIAMMTSLAIIAGTNFLRMFKGAGKWFKGVGKRLKGVGKSIGKTFKSGFKGLGSTFKSVGKSITSGISSAISGLGSLFKGGGKAAAKGGGNIFSRAWKGIKNTASAAWKGTKNIAKKTYQGAKNVVGAIANPKKWFKNMMKSNAGSARKLLKGGGIVSALFGLGEAALILSNKSMDKKEKSRQLVRVGAGTVGAIAGGVLGSLLGPIGSFLGSMGGSILGEWIGSMPAVQDVIAPILEPMIPAGNKVDDFIAVGGKLAKFNKDDLVIGGTNLMGATGGQGGGAGNDEVLERLDRLIALVEQGKVIEMDGVRVAEALDLSKLSVGVG